MKKYYQIETSVASPVQNDIEQKELSHFKDTDKSLNGITLLSEVPPDRGLEVERACKWVEYKTNEIIIDLEDRSTHVFFIARGTVKVIDFLDEGQQIALAELHEGDSFGELSAIDLKKRSARISAAEPTLVGQLSSDDFRNLLFDCPGMALALLKRFSGFIRTLNERVTHLSTLSPHQRIYHELLRLSEPNTEGDGSWIIASAPAHNDLAEWVGVEREIVAQAIGQLARDGVLERKHRRFVIKDHARLLRLAEQ